MVRIKHRYLLVQILYPGAPTSSTSQTSISKATISSTANQFPQIVEFHRPTPDDLTPQVLLKLVRDHIQLLYGDYGVGVVGGALNGKLFSSQVLLYKEVI